MTTLYLTHQSCLQHENGPGHPERPDRLRAIAKVLSHELFDSLTRQDAPAATLEHIALAHPENYIELIKNSRPENGYAFIDPDTSMNKYTWTALLHSIGAATNAVDKVMKGEHKNAFIATRPPGHHAETSRACGFCIFNNIAIAAEHARKAHGAERVAVVDFDVHHGNGTQDIFWSDKNLFYGSTHQMPLFPGTGALNETGVGNIWNAPLSSGDSSDKFKEAMETRVLPALRKFSPDLILISAGFDAHKSDPLANIMLEESDFGWITSELLEIAEKNCNGRVVSILEGGYNLEGLAKSVSVHVQHLMHAAKS
ncbi:MAG: acetoin utilization protein [Rhodomicrobium sp.]|nr:MAG: acetoin utilization protein [Rhodomicrobium sp.]